MKSNIVTKVGEFLEREIASGSFPGASYAVGIGEEIVAEGAHGFAVVEPERIQCSTGTIFDVASLTKPLITTTLVLLAAARGEIDLDAPASSLLPELKDEEKRGITFRDLLTHRAGFRAWLPLYVWGSDLDSYMRRIGDEPLEYERGKRVVYSDFSFISLCVALSRLHGKNVADLSRELLANVGACDSSVVPDISLQRRIAATEWGNSTERKMVEERGLSFDGFRDYVIWGEVNDGNAWHCGGFAGNAGLFATARDVARLASVYLGGKVLPDGLRADATSNHTESLDENRGLGWQMRSASPDHASAPLARGSFGHSGFTGTSVWVDPERRLAFALLTNRLHPRATGADMQRIRRQFHEIAVDALR